MTFVNWASRGLGASNTMSQNVTLSEAKGLVITWNNEILRRYAAQNDISLGALSTTCARFGRIFRVFGAVSR